MLQTGAKEDPHHGHTSAAPDQIIRKLAEGNKLLAGGAELDEVCRRLGIAESTRHRLSAQRASFADPRPIGSNHRRRIEAK
jgi:hypothetical protein